MTYPPWLGELSSIFTSLRIWKYQLQKKVGNMSTLSWGLQCKQKIKGTFSLLNIFSSLHSSNTDCPPSMNVFTVLHVWTIQQLSVFLETDVFMSLPGSGHDDFFGFGYELKRDKKNKKWDVMAIKQRGGAALTGVTACVLFTRHCSYAKIGIGFRISCLKNMQHKFQANMCCLFSCISPWEIMYMKSRLQCHSWRLYIPNTTLIGKF